MAPQLLFFLLFSLVEFDKKLIVQLFTFFKLSCSVVSPLELWSSYNCNRNLKTIFIPLAYSDVYLTATLKTLSTRKMIMTPSASGNTGSNVSFIFEKWRGKTKEKRSPTPELAELEWEYEQAAASNARSIADQWLGRVKERRRNAEDMETNRVDNVNFKPAKRRMIRQYSEYDRAAAKAVLDPGLGDYWLKHCPEKVNMAMCDLTQLKWARDVVELELAQDEERERLLGECQAEDHLMELRLVGFSAFHFLKLLCLRATENNCHK